VLVLIKYIIVVIGPNGPGSHGKPVYILNTEPASLIVLKGSLLPIFEWHIRYILKMINKLQRENIKSYEPKVEAMQDLYNYTHEMFKRLVWSSVCRSWFKSNKLQGRTRLLTQHMFSIYSLLILSCQDL
jgi:hypothetical protein